MNLTMRELVMFIALVITAVIVYYMTAGLS